MRTGQGRNRSLKKKNETNTKRQESYITGNHIITTSSTFTVPILYFIYYACVVVRFIVVGILLLIDSVPTFNRQNTKSHCPITLMDTSSSPRLVSVQLGLCVLSFLRRIVFIVPTMVRVWCVLFVSFRCLLFFSFFVQE